MSRVVLITGCSTGIGRTTALAFAARGDRVYATMRKPVALDGTEVLALDVTDDRTVRAAVETVLEREGRISAVVNNAGVGPFAPIERSTDEEWLATIDTNLLGAVRVARAVLPAMRAAGKGTIVTVSSIAGRIAPIPTQAAYAASKHALCALTDSLNAECGSFGVRAFCVEPGFFATAIMDKDTVAHLDDDDPYKQVMDGIERFFRTSVAAAPAPDAVADLIVSAVDGTLTGGTHHPIGVPGVEPTANVARGSA
jgi:NAD(P)-dependent dehydrogenase (short-subunit alcohol dehydrogenase family)